MRTKLQNYSTSEFRNATETRYKNDGSLLDVTVYGGVGRSKSFSFTGGMATTVDHKTPTAFSWQQDTQNTTGGSLTWWYYGRLSTTREGSFQPWGGSFAIAPGFTSINTTWNQALSRLYDQIIDADLNLATSLAEGRESIDTVAKAGESVARLVSMARSARRDPIAFAKRWGATKAELRRIRRNPSNAVTSAWLSAKLGWMPLCGDIYALAAYRASRLGGGIEVKSSKRRLLRESGKTTSSFGNFRFPATYVTEEMQHVRFVTTWTVSSPTLLELRRITSLNPLAIAWELTPLSFVADWFVDIGGYLKLMEDSLINGLTFKHGCSIVYRQLTEEAETSRVKVVRDVFGDPAYSAVAAVGYTRTRKLYSRSVLTSSPKPMLPKFEPSLGMQRLMTGLSLVRQLLLQRKL